jgi:hypothetical protein
LVQRYDPATIADHERLLDHSSGGFLRDGGRQIPDYHRRRDHENDQHDQHDIDERGHVDFGSARLDTHRLVNE